jgi:hypothetical protein
MRGVGEGFEPGGASAGLRKTRLGIVLRAPDTMEFCGICPERGRDPGRTVRSADAIRLKAFGGRCRPKRPNALTASRLRSLRSMHYYCATSSFTACYCVCCCVLVCVSVRLFVRCERWDGGADRSSAGGHDGLVGAVRVEGAEGEGLHRVAASAKCQGSGGNEQR